MCIIYIYMYICICICIYTYLCKQPFQNHPQPLVENLLNFEDLDSAQIKKEVARNGWYLWVEIVKPCVGTVSKLRSLMSPSTTWWMPTWFSLELWLWSLRVIHLSSPNCTTHFCPFRNGCTNGRRVSRCCGEEVYSMSFKDLNQRG